MAKIILLTPTARLSREVAYFKKLGFRFKRLRVITKRNFHPVHLPKRLF